MHAKAQRITDQQDGEGGERALEAYSAFKAQLRVVADAIPGHVWYATPLGALVFINSRSADYLQLPKDHPLRFGIDVGGDWDAHIPLLHPDDHEETRRVWSTCLHTGTAGEVSFRLRDPEGNYRWFLSLAAPLRADDGTLVCWVGVNFDIEDRKRAEDKIREQEADVRQILDFSPQMIAVFGPQRERLYVNRIALDYFGLTLDEWRAAAPGAVSHPDDTKRVKTKWDSGMSSGRAFELEGRLRRSDGSYRWFLVRYHPVCDERGEVRRWYAACTDIEDRKQAEERLQRENAALREELNQSSMFEEIVGSSEPLRKGAVPSQ